MDNKKPGLFLALKILAAVFLCVAIAGIVLVITGFGDFENQWKFILGGFMTTLGIFLTSICAATGFSREMAKVSVKMTKHIQNATKEDLTDIANTQAQIQSGAVKTIAGAARDGFDSAGAQTKFCKHCGTKIDEDSRFCKECGKEQ